LVIDDLAGALIELKIINWDQGSGVFSASRVFHRGAGIARPQLHVSPGFARLSLTLPGP
jgi:hypothetical protein